MTVKHRFNFKNYLIWIPLAIGIFWRSDALACCEGQWIEVLPRNSHIAANSLFLLSFSERDYKFKNTIPHFSFYAFSTKRGKIKLEIKQIYFAGSNGQILLKPASAFQLNDSILLLVLLPSATDSVLGNIFKGYVESKRWIVTGKVDKNAPQWKSDSLTFSIHDARQSSAPTLSVFFACPITDNSFSDLTFKFYDLKLYPVFYEVTLNKETFICSDHNLGMDISWGMCGNTFADPKVKINEVTIKPFDSSGNYAGAKTIIFSLP